MTQLEEFLWPRVLPTSSAAAAAAANARDDPRSRQAQGPAAAGGNAGGGGATGGAGSAAAGATSVNNAAATKGRGSAAGSPPEGGTAAAGGRAGGGRPASKNRPIPQGRRMTRAQVRCAVHDMQMLMHRQACLRICVTACAALARQPCQVAAGKECWQLGQRADPLHCTLQARAAAEAEAAGSMEEGLPAGGAAAPPEPQKHGAEAEGGCGKGGSGGAGVERGVAGWASGVVGWCSGVDSLHMQGQCGAIIHTEHTLLVACGGCTACVLWPLTAKHDMHAGRVPPGRHGAHV